MSEIKNRVIESKKSPKDNQLTETKETADMQVMTWVATEAAKAAFKMTTESTDAAEGNVRRGITGRAEPKPGPAISKAANIQLDNKR